MNNKYVFRLLHNHKIKYDGNDWICDSKLLGYFTSIQQAQNIIKKYKKVTGFKGKHRGETGVHRGRFSVLCAPILCKPVKEFFVRSTPNGSLSVSQSGLFCDCKFSYSKPY